MSLIDRIEKKGSWLAIPHLLSIVAGLQVLVYLLMLIRGPAVAEGFTDLLSMNGHQVRQGEIWRLFSYIFLPKSTQPIFVIFGAYVLHITGQYIEQVWGSFRLTLFFLSTVLLISLGLLITGWHTAHSLEPEVEKLLNSLLGESRAPYILYGMLGMLLGLKCPRIEFRLYFVVPVSAAFLGWLALATLLWSSLKFPELHWAIALGGLPFICTALPAFYNWYYLKERIWKNRPAFEEAKHQFDDHFSKCLTCARTDKSNPELLFRVAADGEEYCQEHLPKS
jgi:membrane associated rhomboid family serine protease